MAKKGHCDSLKINLREIVRVQCKTRYCNANHEIVTREVAVGKRMQCENWRVQREGEMRGARLQRKKSRLQRDKSRLQCESWRVKRKVRYCNAKTRDCNAKTRGYMNACKIKCLRLFPIRSRNRPTKIFKMYD